MAPGVESLPWAKIAKQSQSNGGPGAPGLKDKTRIPRTRPPAADNSRSTPNLTSSHAIYSAEWFRDS